MGFPLFFIEMITREINFIAQVMKKAAQAMNFIAQIAYFSLKLVKYTFNYSSVAFLLRNPGF